LRALVVDPRTPYREAVEQHDLTLYVDWGSGNILHHRGSRDHAQGVRLSQSRHLG